MGRLEVLKKKPIGYCAMYAHLCSYIALQLMILFSTVTPRFLLLSKNGCLVVVKLHTGEMLLIRLIHVKEKTYENTMIPL
jgi:hypothetical protein